MRRRQLKSLRISFVALSFLLYFNASVAVLTRTGAEPRQQIQPQSLVTRSVHQQQPQAGGQHDARRSQPFNALLTSVGQLADSPLRHGGHLALAARQASGRKRVTRAANDGEGMDFGDYFQSLIRFVVNSIGAILKFFAPTAGDEESK